MRVENQGQEMRNESQKTSVKKRESRNRSSEQMLGMVRWKTEFTMDPAGLVRFEKTRASGTLP